MAPISSPNEVVSAYLGVFAENCVHDFMKVSKPSVIPLSVKRRLGFSLFVRNHAVPSANPRTVFVKASASRLEQTTNTTSKYGRGEKSNPFHRRTWTLRFAAGLLLERNVNKFRHQEMSSPVGALRRGPKQ